MSIKKYTNGSWTPACRKYGTETDTITTFPATIIGDGTPITSYTVKGNMEQNGTPTPSSPIYPSECGGRTENLFDSSTINFNHRVDGNGYIIYDSRNDCSDYIEVESATYYHQNGNAYISEYDTNKGFVKRTTTTQEGMFKTSDTTKYIISSLSKGEYTNYMIIKGQNFPSEYIPYGYKLPITLGSTTTDIYLGEVQSTRRVKKLVLTGEEDWSKNDTAISGATIFTRTINDGLTGYTPYCTHYAGSNSTTWVSIPTNSVTVSIVSDGVQRLAINVGVAYSEIIDFKTYLRQQYAAGTPVTVWYVLETPTTGILNEPLRKIGDYVDSVSGTNLATSGTAQEFDVGTALKPSEADLTYHGWHEHDDTKYST